MDEIKVRKFIREELNVIQESMWKFTEDFHKDVSRIREDLQRTVNDMFEDSIFMINFKKALFRTVEQEVRVALSEYQLQDLIKSKVNDVIDNSLHEIIEIVVKNIVSNVNKKLDLEYKTTKKLVYSIDSEISHVLKRTPICANTETIMKNKIYELLSKIEVKNPTITLKPKTNPYTTQ